MLQDIQLAKATEAVFFIRIYLWKFLKNWTTYAPTGEWHGTLHAAALTVLTEHLSTSEVMMVLLAARDLSCCM